ncbi:hypothetical protein [Marinitoga lauensis]|uniref:hypothetical protein n=1 Tax=Marinitoga lauensis TaxID=2201189 RepID=UPI001012BD9B|nr:hypothetical protein [Marinitoga lauensis]
MNYYICELIDENNEIIKIALKDEILGVSKKFIKKNVEGKFLGYSKFKDTLYPVLTLPGKKSFILKNFLIYSSFAFGVTSIVKKVSIEKFESFNDETLKIFPDLEIFSGYFEYDFEDVFIYNINKADVKLPKNYIIKTTKEKDFSKKEENIPNAFIIDNKFAILKGNSILSIIDKNSYCPFKYKNYSGFIEYKNKIFPVKKTSNNSKWIIVTKK